MGRRKGGREGGSERESNRGAKARRTRRARQLRLTAAAYRSPQSCMSEDGRACCPAGHWYVPCKSPEPLSPEPLSPEPPSPPLHGLSPTADKHWPSSNAQQPTAAHSDGPYPRSSQAASPVRPASDRARPTDGAPLWSRHPTAQHVVWQHSDSWNSPHQPPKQWRSQLHRACVPGGQNFVPPVLVSSALRQPSPSSPWYQHVHCSGVGVSRQQSCCSQVEPEHVSQADM